MTKNTPFRCYLCGSSSYSVRPGKVRDNPDLLPLECSGCGLVALSSFDHISPQFYEESQMHAKPSVSQLLSETQTLEDDSRRFKDFLPLFVGKNLLDYGCGSGRFLSFAKNIAESVAGVELDKSWHEVHSQFGLDVRADIAEYSCSFDVISMFHVLEHIPDPLPLLQHMREYCMEKEGTLIIEVPSANDALLTLYKNKAFSEFTYWSCHLFLHTATTLERLLAKAGFKALQLTQFQRYPLSNHLYWLENGKPGGQKIWQEINDPVLDEAYRNKLAALGKCDTIIGIFTPTNG